MGFGTACDVCGRTRCGVVIVFKACAFLGGCAASTHDGMYNLSTQDECREEELCFGLLGNRNGLVDREISLSEVAMVVVVVVNGHLLLFVNVPCCCRGI